MTTIELRDFIKSYLPDWWVTINEAELVNVQADDLERFAGFAYVEELTQKNVSYTRYGRDATHAHDVYFCVLGEFDLTAEQREDIRERRIRPVVYKVEEALHNKFGIDEFKEDLYPRGFDANEILIHIAFKSKGKECGI